MDYLSVLENVQNQIIKIINLIKDTFDIDHRELLELRLENYIITEKTILTFLEKDITPVVTTCGYDHGS